MYHSTAVIPTDRAARYRDQLASHGASMAAMHASRASDGHAPPVLDAATREESVVLRVGGGRCTMTATAEALHIRAEAETLDALAKIQNGSATASPRSAAATT